MPKVPYWRILRRLCPSVSSGEAARPFILSLSKGERGVGLMEVLIGLVLVVTASLATLTYYSYGMGGMGKQENRRAALEIARQRLEQLMTANINCVAGSDSNDGRLFWLTVPGAIAPCTWGRTADTGTPGNPVPVPEPGGVLVNQLPNPMRMETTAQWRDDEPYAGTSTLDTVELSVKVWFTPNTGTDDDSNRVYLRTLRT